MENIGKEGGNMARKAAGERLNRYEAKLDPERVKQDLIKLKPGMLGKQTITAQDLEGVETRTRAVLNDSDVVTIMYPAYYDFARILYRLVSQFGGGQGLTKEVEIQRDVWTARGLSKAILTRIAYEAFGLTLS
jgi:hypothetical protein